MSDLSSPFNNTDSPLAEKSKSQEDDLTKLSMDAHEIDTSKSLWMVDSFTPTKVLKTLSRKRSDIPIPDFSLGTRKTFVKEERAEIKNQIGGLVGERDISFELDGEQPPESLIGVISEDDDESEQSRSPSKQGSPSTFISTVSFKKDNNVSIQFGSTTIDDISEINGIPESLEDIAEEEDQNVFQSNKPSTPDGSFSHKLADMEETPKTPEQSEENNESEQDDKIDSDNESVVFTSRADEQKALPDYNPSLNSVLRKSLTERRLQISPKSTPILSRKAQDNDGEKIEYPTVQDENEAINKFYEELSAKIASMEQDQTTQSLSPKERHYAALLILLNTIKKQEVIDNQTANSKLSKTIKEMNEMEDRIHKLKLENESLSKQQREVDDKIEQTRKKIASCQFDIHKAVEENSHYKREIQQIKSHSHDIKKVLEKKKKEIMERAKDELQATNVVQQLLQEFNQVKERASLLAIVFLVILFLIK